MGYIAQRLSILVSPDLAWSFIDDTVHADIDAPSRSDGYGGIEPVQGSGLTVGFRAKSRIYDQVIGQGGSSSVDASLPASSV
jgi:hypothetical protein